MKLTTRSGHVFECEIIKEKYQNNNRIALQAVDSDGIGPVAKLTVNLPDLPCPDGFAWIKNYSENEGFMEQLIEAGILAEPIDNTQSGWVTVYLCQVLI